jgi:hypothetical protein
MKPTNKVDTTEDIQRLVNEGKDIPKITYFVSTITLI